MADDATGYSAEELPEQIRQMEMFMAGFSDDFGPMFMRDVRRLWATIDYLTERLRREQRAADVESEVLTLRLQSVEESLEYALENLWMPGATNAKLRAALTPTQPTES